MISEANEKVDHDLHSSLQFSPHSLGYEFNSLEAISVPKSTEDISARIVGLIFGIGKFPAMASPCGNMLLPSGLVTCAGIHLILDAQI